MGIGVSQHKATYFANIKHLKKKYKNVHMFPILQIGKNRHQRKHNNTTDKIEEILKQKKEVLYRTPIDWNKFHLLTSDILDLLAKQQQHTMQYIIYSGNQRFLRIDLVKPTTKVIYSIINLKHHQNKVYIGQTGMHRRKVLDRKRSWQDLERAPLQRM